MYLLLFFVGLIGFVTMAALSMVGGHGHGNNHSGHSVGHGDHSALGHGHGHLGHGHVGHPHATPAHTTPAHTGNHGVVHDASGVPGSSETAPIHLRTVSPKTAGLAKGAAKPGRGFPTWLLISPLDVFSLSLGAGSAGLLAAGKILEPLLLVFAIFCGILFNYLAIRPMMSFMLGFASKPIEGLEGALAKPSQATTSFDATGRGLVTLSLDGEVVQILARLDEDELSRGVKVRSGDTLLVIDIDPVRNSCRVSKELAS